MRAVPEFTRDGVAVVEMRLAARVEFDRAATVHLEPQAPIFTDTLNRSQFAVRHFEMVRGRSELDAVAANWNQLSRLLGPIAGPLIA